MRRSKAFRVGLAVAVVSTPAWAVKVGEMLYIRSKDTALVKKADPKAPVVTKLQPGTEVVWEGPDATNKQFHKVKAGGKEGYVLQANLTPSKPLDETGSDGKGISARAVASSGAATRTLSETGQKYAEKTPDHMMAAQQVVMLEGINVQIKDKDVQDHAAKQGLPKAGGK
jgi:hypothetical protein